LTIPHPYHHLMMSKGLKSARHKVGSHRPTTLRVYICIMRPRNSVLQPANF